jgi:class 3 adenylate cyclase
VAAFTTSTRLGRAFELKVSDSFRALASLPDEKESPVPIPTTIIGIDDPALRQYGHWPWDWARLADITDLLRELDARLIVFDIELLEKDPDRVVTQVDAYGRPQEHILRTVPRLVESVRAAGNVLLPFSLYIRGRAGTDASDAGPAGAADPWKDVSEDVHRAMARYAARFDPPSACPPDHLRTAEGLQPMVEELIGACAGSGYTSILHDEEDFKVRRIPLLVRAGDTVFPHLMLEAAGVWRFGPDYRVRLEGERFILLSPDGKDSVSLPVDRAAMAELRWPRSLKSLDIVAVAPVVRVIEARRRNRTVMAQLDVLFPQEGWAAARRRLDEAEAAAYARAPGAPTRQAIQQLRADLTAIEERLAMDLASAATEPGAAPAAAEPASAAPAAAAPVVAAPAAAAPAPVGQPDERARRLRSLAEEHLAFLGEYHDPKQGVEATLALLHPHVTGRLCLLGFYATAFDLHTTPIGDDQPGVTVYPAGIQTILSGVALRHLSGGAEFLIIMLAAGLVAVTLRLSTGRGIAATVLVSAAVVGVGALGARQALLLPVAGPTLAVVVAFAGVSTYRQLTEASSRRWVVRVFEQYSSAELLEEIMRDPESLRLGGERRDITFLFSDIAGFTPLSERLDPEQLVALLNHYLSAMTNIILAERAKLDKYEGDGVLALFGAPVRVPDHALRAVRAALAMHAALPRVNEELVGMGLLPEGTRLAMRVGCSTGPAIVGNFGSERRFDYTAMGDTVNLGGRLEEANRWLASRILVPEATRTACGDVVLFRPFGPCQIRGKVKPVLLYEPLAPEPAPADLKALAEAFGRAIDALQARNVDAAEAALRDLLAMRPDDGPTRVLRERIEAVRAGRAPPDEPWNLARSK